MTYTSPELHLIGSAQHLVLGKEMYEFTNLGCDNDDIFVHLSDFVELW